MYARKSLTVVTARPRRVVIGKDDWSIFNRRRRGDSDLDIGELLLRWPAKQEGIFIKRSLEGGIQRRRPVVKIQYTLLDYCALGENTCRNLWYFLRCEVTGSRPFTRFSPWSGQSEPYGRDDSLLLSVFGNTDTRFRVTDHVGVSCYLASFALICVVQIYALPEDLSISHPSLPLAHLKDRSCKIIGTPRD